MKNKLVKVDWDTDGRSPEECGLPEEVSVPWDMPDDKIADYCSDTYGFCVNSWFEISNNANMKNVNKWFRGLDTLALSTIFPGLYSEIMESADLETNVNTFVDKAYKKWNGISDEEKSQIFNQYKNAEKHDNMKNKKFLLTEAVQDITITAWDEIRPEVDAGLVDSRAFLSECRLWAEEFEKLWSKMENEDLPHDYMLEVEDFAEKKAKEYAEHLHLRNGESKYKVSVTLPLTLWVEVWARDEQEALEKARDIAEKTPAEEWGDDMSTMTLDIVRQ